ncbi:MAG: hypothetical protein IJ215_03850 [Clostridia bacterium]|nr:hypothetical protein [Clostridia bacterium]
MSKYFNDAIIGNSKILASLTNKGELMRLYYPSIDYFQNIDKNQIGIVKDNRILWLHDANQKSQYYEGNIVYTELFTDEYEILQRDYVLPNKNILVRTFQFNKQLNLFVYSKLNSDVNKKVSSMVVDNTLIQYCQEMYMATLSSLPIAKYQINNSKYALENGNLYSEDYIGMSEDSAILYSNTDQITLYIALENNLNGMLKTIEWCKKQQENILYERTKKYWNDYLKKFENNIVFQNINRIKEKEIMTRSILMYALVTNKDTGAVLASPDVDETFDKCGRYGYCWPRDALFINTSLNILGLSKITDKFYHVWARKAQLKSGLFEQRYYSSGELAPSWGIQIDETAAMLIGIYQNKKYKSLETVIVPAITGLLNFIDGDYLSRECFDIWEERKGKHLYSTASIYEGLQLGKKMLEAIDKEKYKSTILEIEKTLLHVKDAIFRNFIEAGSLKRSTDNNQTDISLLSLAVPFHILDADDVIIKNTVQKIENDLSLPNGGYARYQWDNYIGGNAWIISSLWLALYYIKVENYERARELFDWVTNHADNLGFLAEQIDSKGDNVAWIKQLSWSHAMYIIVKSKLK